MADNIHPVVELLAARMESHPEEFGPHGQGRWGTWLKQMEPLLTEEEKLMLRGPEMQDIHEEVLDELLNGEQRRAEEKRARDLEMQRLMSQAQAIQSNTQNRLYNSAQSTLSALSTNALSNSALNIGGETVDAGLIRNIKQALGLK